MVGFYIDAAAVVRRPSSGGRRVPRALRQQDCAVGDALRNEWRFKRGSPSGGARDKCLSGIRMGAPGLGTKVGLLRVGEQKWASQGWDEKGGCQGCAKKRVLKAHAGRKMLPRLAQLTQGMANLAISWVVMRFRWPKQRIGGLNKASLTRAQPAPNYFEAHKNGAKRASQQLACLAPATTAAGTEPSEASRPRRGRFALQRNPEGGVPLHCNRLRL